MTTPQPRGYRTLTGQELAAVNRFKDLEDHAGATLKTGDPYRIDLADLNARITVELDRAAALDGVDEVMLDHARQEATRALRSLADHLIDATAQPPVLVEARLGIAGALMFAVRAITRPDSALTTGWPR